MSRERWNVGLGRRVVTYTIPDSQDIWRKISREKADCRFGPEVDFQASWDGEFHDTNKLVVAAFIFSYSKNQERDCYDRIHREWCLSMLRTWGQDKFLEAKGEIWRNPEKLIEGWQTKLFLESGKRKDSVIHCIHLNYIPLSEREGG